MNELVENVLVAAVGGQGALLAARVLGRYALERGLDVKVSEIHGMSQRGGSVVTHVRFGAKVFSPVIEKGAADTILGFEALEALRYAEHLRPGGAIFFNSQEIPPLPVLTGVANYPANIDGQFALLGVQTLAIDARALAERAGSDKAVNTVLLGVYAGHQRDAKDVWLAALRASVPQKHIDTNLRAFDLGYAFAALNPAVAH